MMRVSQTLELLLYGNQLKRTVRTGWVQRGITSAEDVAAHSYGTAYAALILGKMISQPLNMERVLVMALLHDLPEGITTDIPTPAWKYLPEGIKSDVERKAMHEILGDSDSTRDLMRAWEELHEQRSPESLLVHDADKLDLYLQAFMYEQQTGNRQLEEFWKKPYTFHYPESQEVYIQIASLRAGDKR